MVVMPLNVLKKQPESTRKCSIFNIFYSWKAQIKSVRLYISQITFVDLKDVFGVPFSLKTILKGELYSV